MSGLNPTGPSQPTTSAAYTTAQNPASKTPAEAQQAAQPDISYPADRRIPQTQSTPDQANEWGLGRGIHGAPPGEESKGLTEEDVGRHKELDGEQMYMPGEGRVADAVAGRGGGGEVGGEQIDLASDLDRKKAEQAEAREAIKQQRAENTAIGGRAGQQGGPASTMQNAQNPAV